MDTRRKFLKKIAGATAGLALINIPEKLLAKEDLVKICILHTNDIHSHIDPFPETGPSHPGNGGLARLSGLIQNIRELQKNVLLFDAGDMFQGTPYFNYYKGELILKVMTKMGYDASTLGNHEFDNGLEGIDEAIGFAGFPFICSNYDFSNTILNGSFSKYKIYQKDGVKIGVYGLGIEVAGLVARKNYRETVWLDPVKIALNMESFLKNEKKCDLVLCLSHLGIKYQENKISDSALAAQTRFTDMIIGGHTHTFLEEPLYIKNAEGNRIIVNQAGWGGLMLGRVDFIFDKEGTKTPLALSQNIYSAS